MSDTRNWSQLLARPFEAAEVKFKPQVVQGQRALALAYVDARTIQDRLDSVLGVEGWQDEYAVLKDGSVVCRLKLKIGNDWIVKEDVGGPSEQPDEGDRMKAAFSDALKRAAVKFGVGRYLYRLPSQWVDYDPVKRQFTRTPSLPPAALPNLQGRQEPAPARPALAVTPAAETVAAQPGELASPEIVRELHGLITRRSRHRVWKPYLIEAGYEIDPNWREPQNEQQAAAWVCQFFEQADAEIILAKFREAERNVAAHIAKVNGAPAGAPVKSGR